MLVRWWYKRNLNGLCLGDGLCQKTCCWRNFLLYSFFSIVFFFTLIIYFFHHLATCLNSNLKSENTQWPSFASYIWEHELHCLGPLDLLVCLDRLGQNFSTLLIFILEKNITWKKCPILVCFKETTKLKILLEWHSFLVGHFFSGLIWVAGQEGAYAKSGGIFTLWKLHQMPVRREISWSPL